MGGGGTLHAVQNSVVSCRLENFQPCGTLVRFRHNAVMIRISTQCNRFDNKGDDNDDDVDDDDGEIMWRRLVVILDIFLYRQSQLSHVRPRWLTFTWWGCYDLYLT